MASSEKRPKKDASPKKALIASVTGYAMDGFDLLRNVRAVACQDCASLLGMSAPDAALLMVLSASASYIAVPAVVRYAIPEADPSLYVSLSLGVTFPLNILVGIPLYTQVVLRLWGG